QPPFGSANVGDITTPRAIDTARLFYAKPSAQHILRDSILMLRISRLRSPAPARSGSQTGFPHQFGNEIAPAAAIALTQFLVDARAAIGAAAGFVNRRDHLTQTLTPPGTATRRTSLSRIEAGPTNFECSTHQRYRKLMSMSSDAGVLHDRSFAKYAAAFFKKSSSSRNVSFSRRNRLISSSWLTALGLPRNNSFGVGRGRPSTCSLQSRNIFGRIPSDAAISETDCLPSITKRTASSLNSRVKTRRFSPMDTSSPDTICRLSWCPQFQGNSTASLAVTPATYNYNDRIERSAFRLSSV